MTWIVFQVFQLFRLSLLIVGNLVCLVMLCLISMRRDKVCPQYRVRNWANTNTLQTLQKLYGPLGNSCMTSLKFIWAKMMRFWPCYSKNTEVWATFSQPQLYKPSSGQKHLNVHLECLPGRGLEAEQSPQCPKISLGLPSTEAKSITFCKETSFMLLSSL